ncbi:acyl-CoA-binding protein, putative [Plasmodium vivax]|uniref:Acyl-CoA-binding protein, putative n=1 Tax=Plasmodium vivax TaxID=5855 RepID=A0A564ZWM5_PLAVI|nr:acyl-CoA-binding protein, putative [Plasmodium vivax]
MLRSLNGKTLLLANVASACIILYALRRYCPEQTNRIFNQIEGVAKWLLKTPQQLLHKWLDEWRKKKKKKIHLPVVDKDVTIPLSDDELNEKFIRACNAVKVHKGQLNFEQWMYLYGLYKQITSGDVSPDAGHLDKPLSGEDSRGVGTPTKRRSEDGSFLMDAKMSAWGHFRGVGERVCKFLYVQFVEEALPQGIEAEGLTVAFDFTKTMSKMKPLAEVLTGVPQGSVNEGDPSRGDGGYPTGGDSADRTGNLSDLLCKNVVQANLQYIKSALKSNPYLVNKRNSDGLCALHYACDRGYLDIVKVLIELGADVNADDSCGDTALHIAAYSGQTEIIKYLTSAGADVNRKNSEGLTFNKILSQEAELY